MSTSQIDGSTLDSNRCIEIFSIICMSKRAEEDFAQFDTGGKCRVAQRLCNVVVAIFYGPELLQPSYIHTQISL